MSRGTGGTWNRAGRRSGGDRPIDLTPAPEVSCTCGTTAVFGLLPIVLLGGCMEVKTCPGCGGALFVRRPSGWVTAQSEVSDG